MIAEKASRPSTRSALRSSGDDSRSGAKLAEPSASETLHQCANTKCPRFAFIAGAHAVDELAEFRRLDRDDIIALVGKPLPRHVAIFHRSEHRSEDQCKSVRILMLPADRLRNQVFRVATDFAYRRMSLDNKTIITPDRHRQIHFANVVE